MLISCMLLYLYKTAFRTQLKSLNQHASRISCLSIIYYIALAKELVYLFLPIPWFRIWFVLANTLV